MIFQGTQNSRLSVGGLVAARTGKCSRRVLINMPGLIKLSKTTELQGNKRQFQNEHEDKEKVVFRHFDYELRSIK